MKKIIFIFVTAVLLTTSAVAQSAEKVSKILESEEISKGEASYFSCVYKNLAEENISENEAFDILAQKNLFAENENADEKISLSKACYLISETSGMKGGIFYSIFKSARYSFREFKALGIIPKNAEPAQNVSGSDFIALLNGFDKKGKTK